MKNKLLLSLCTAGLLCLPSFANDVQVQQQDITEQNKYVEETQSIDIDDEIEEQIQDYADNQNFQFGLDGRTGKHFIYSIESVASKPTDPDFVKSLSVTYEKAFFAAQQEFVMDVFGKVVSQKETKLFADNSTNAREFDSDKVDNKGIMAKMGRVFDKAFSLAEKTLDNALIDLGVDAADIEKLNKKEKKTLFKNEFIATSMKEAFGSVSGFIPIKSFVGKDSSGQYAVGVIAMRTEKTSQVAKDISMQRESMIEGRGKDLRDIVPTDKKALLNEMGVRLVFDLNGSPALISYGQWGFNSKGLSAYMKSQAKKNAKSMAQDIADSMVSDFVNGNLQVNTSSEHGEIIEQVLEREGSDGMVVDKTIKTIVDTVNQSAKLKSSMKLAGFSTIRRWSTTNEHGHYVAGVVRKWTFSGLAAAKSVQQNRAPKKERTRQRESSERSNYSRSVNESNEYNTVNDF
ncbi:hypothetical protein JHD48_05800 [Sulfurimonas sp. SAG-AH-194-I05]|nr:hypothetical protein [Sulfurimonas sp. SAG-AH-194-I05]MDF1875239.1 hypothetical protein [Sulfurimonas sp. SAG-AH-194-I05]